MSNVGSMNLFAKAQEAFAKASAERVAAEADAAIRGFCGVNHAFEILPRDWQSALNDQALMPNVAVYRPVKTEVEIQRERIAALEAQIAALTPAPAAPAPNPMARAIARWPGSQGFIQGIRWRGV